MRMDIYAWQAIADLMGTPKPAYRTVSVSVTHNGEAFDIDANIAPLTSQASIGTATANGLTLNYQSSAYDSATSASGFASTNFTMTYAITGEAVLNGSSIVVAARTTLYVEYHQHVMGVDSHSASGNVVDLMYMATYDITPGPVAGDYTATLSGQTSYPDRSEEVDVWYDNNNQVIPQARQAAQDAVLGWEPAITWALSPSRHQHPKVVGTKKSAPRIAPRGAVKKKP